MPRIPYPDLAGLPPEVRAHIGERPANVSRMLATASGPVFHHMSAMGGAFINGSSLPPQLRELAILRVGYISNAEYEVFQHEALARHVGMSEAQLAAIKAGDCAAPSLDRAQRDVLAFVDDLVANVRAGDATLGAVKRHLDNTQLVDLILVTGFYMLICRLLETAGVELDEAPIDWSTIVQAR